MRTSNILALSLAIVISISSIVSSNASVATTTSGYFVKMIASDLNGPHNLVFDEVGNLYVAEEEGTTITKIAPDGQVSIFADGFAGPSGLACDKDGNIWVGDDGHSYEGVSYNIWKIAPDGTVTPGSVTMFANPNTLAFDKDWNLFVVETYGDIWKISPSGTVIHFAGGFSCPQAIAFNKEGNVYTADADGTIWKLDPSGSTRIQYAKIDSNMGNFAFDEYDNLYAPDNVGEVVIISPSGQSQTFVTGLSLPRGVALDSKGQLYIGDYNTGNVWKVGKSNFYLSIQTDPPGVANIPGEGWYDFGTSVTTGIASTTISVVTGTRYVFQEWIMDGNYQPGNPVSVVMNVSHEAVAKYMNQHYLTVTSDYGDPEGEGWYDANTTVTFSVTSPIGILIQHVFVGWSGDSSLTTTTGTIMMNGPKMVIANWRTDYIQLYIIILIIAVAIIIIALTRRRKKNDVNL